MYTFEELRALSTKMLETYWRLQQDTLVQAVNADEDLLNAKRIVGKGVGAKEFHDELLRQLEDRED